MIPAVDENLTSSDEQLPASLVTGQPVAASAHSFTGARLRTPPSGGVGEIAHYILKLASSAWFRNEVTTDGKATAQSRGRGAVGAARRGPTDAGWRAGGISTLACVILFP